MVRRFLPGLLSIYVLSGCDVGESSKSPSDSPGSHGTVIRGCTSASPPPTAPGGYYTNGTTVCTADGVAHLFHGVDRPSLEWDPKGEGNNSAGIAASDFQAMANWHANVVRIALNQDFWLSGAAMYDPDYPGTVDKAVQDAEAAGLDVILDLHWSDQGDWSATSLGKKQGTAGDVNQQPMADKNSIQFWAEVAAKYQTDGHVLFELYNEPHDIPWSTWLNGGSGSGYQIVGMQELYDTVRQTGANNVVIAGGVDWAFDLSGASGTPINGYNIMYATHPYDPQDPVSRWDTAFGYLATGDIAPVIATEFGDGSSKCTGDWDTQLIAYADARQISWTAWAWWAAGCSFPALISDWQYTATDQGQVVKGALLGYPYTPGGNPNANADTDAGTNTPTNSAGAPNQTNEASAGAAGSTQ